MGYRYCWTYLLPICMMMAAGCAQEPRQGTDEVPVRTASARTAAVEYDSYGFRVDTLKVREYTVRPNESLYLILDQFDLPPNEIYSVTRHARGVLDVRDFKPGQKYRAYVSTGASNELYRLVWHPDPVNFVVFELNGGEPEIINVSKSVLTRRESAAVEINSSLYESIADAGLSPLLAFKLSEIYAWEIDFFNLRRGDRFKAVYEQKYVDGEYLELGEILAAEFTHRGETYRAYRFRDGYYDGEGNSVQKALLKAPFKFSQRISSGFSRSRYHPVLKRRIPHYGVDYAAPYGTPVLATGDGTVTEARYRGANGNIVKIRHNGSYETAYLHLKGFAGGIRRGATVRQGQVIGYVGNTGRVTGTHLDYRIYRNGRPVNPLTVELPSSESIPEASMDAFIAMKNRLEEQFEGLGSERPMARGTQ